MIVKEHSNGGDIILAICDKALIGKKLQFNNTEIEIGDFYKGEEKEQNEIEELIKKATVINAIGKKTIDFLKEKINLQEDNIIYMQDVPHAQVFRII